VSVGRSAKLLLIAIAVGFVLGILFGYTVSVTLPKNAQTVLADWFKALGDIFVRLIRVVIPLLIFFTIAAATSSIASAKKLGKVLVLILIVYIVTSALAAF
jgi:Na+/H+-dicarboxylate symporter